MAIQLHVIDGNLVHQKATIAVPIPSDGLSMPIGINGAVMQVAGNLYHDVIRRQARQGDLPDGFTLLVSGSSANHRGTFDNILFVVDDLKLPLHQIIGSVLEAAAQEGITSLSIPIMRTGFNAGYGPEKTKRAVAMEYRKALHSFQQQHPNYVIDITFVVFHDQAMINALKSEEI